MGDSKLVWPVIFLAILCLVASALPGGCQIPDELLWVTLVGENRECSVRNVHATLDDAPISKYLLCPILPGDRVLPGDYPVDERFLLRVPDKKGTIVARYSGKIIFRKPVQPEPFTKDDFSVVAVIVDGQTKTTWMEERFRTETEIVLQMFGIQPPP